MFKKIKITHCDIKLTTKILFVLTLGIRLSAQQPSNEFYSINGWMPDKVGSSGPLGGELYQITGTSPNFIATNYLRTLFDGNNGYIRYGGNTSDANFPTFCTSTDDLDKFVLMAQNHNLIPIVQIPFIYNFKPFVLNGVSSYNSGSYLNSLSISSIIDNIVGPNALSNQAGGLTYKQRIESMVTHLI